PGTPSRIYATSFFDGRVNSRSGINVSNDGGATWLHPPTSNPPSGFCANAADQVERAAFGIDFDPGNPANVFIGTSCGLARSTDSGATWTYVDPTPAAGSATRVWDVLALGGGVLHVCGDDGHLRSGDGGNTWVPGSGLSSGRCSLAVSPDEPYVVFAVVGTSIFETENADAPGGASWTQTRTNPSPQGRVPFVETNQRSDAGPDNVFDLWFGDVSLFRVSCTTPAPPAPGGSPRCGTAQSPAWVGGFTRGAGGHDDTGALLFDPLAANDACPLLMSSDGGVYFNTDTTADCHNPDWEQPNVTPHALWPFAMSGSDRAGGADEDLYFGNQDNGLFGTTTAGGASPSWHNEVCCDGFDAAGDPAGGVYTVCCFGGGGRSNRVFRTAPGFFSASELTTYPPGGLTPTFDFPDSIVHYGGGNYAMVTRDCTAGVSGCPAADGGVFITSNIDANPVVWTELGNLSEPPTASLCAVQVALSGADPTFFVQTGSCNNSTTTDRFFKFTPGIGAVWTELLLPAGGVGVFAVHPKDPQRLLASGLTAGGGAMFSSADGGASWSPVPALDDLMTGGGEFPFKNQRGPTRFTGFNGYWQPSLVAFDGDSDLVVAGGQDSGVFPSLNGGTAWQRISDPLTSDVSGVPHLPRPRYAYFDTETGEPQRIFIGSQGKGIWRIGVVIDPIFSDGFESG
ncbi:MAG: hypothetical protein KDD47_27635, partial [Acidobacteria bacterium]|nr:hypothetical protein [Acidobacteriota bacterium]